MRFDAPAAGSRRRAVPALAVLTLHALLLALWLQARAPPQVAEADPVAWLRLLEPAAPAVAPAEPTEPGAPRPRTAGASVVRAITSPAVTSSPTVPMAAEPPAAAGSGALLPAAPAASGAVQATLDLTLPRQPQAPWRERNPALDDPRSNTRPPATVEARIASVMGDGRWQVERLDNDRVRYRSGSRCVIATRSRAGQIELAGGAFRELWLVSDC